MNSNHAIAPRGRLLLAALGLAACAALALAATLEPDPRGYGTHEQLGWSPCWFRHVVGRPCPACGMTTAWAYAVRGELRSAATANAAGVVACGVAALAAPWLLISAAAGRWVVAVPTPRAALTVAAALFALGVFDWTRRLIAP